MCQMSDECGLVPAMELESGKIYVLMDYKGICDHCGGEIGSPWMMVMYVGRYQDEWGHSYECYQTCFYLMCHACRYFINYIRRFDPMEALVLFKKEEKDETPG